MGREATLAEAIHVQVVQQPKKKVVRVVAEGDGAEGDEELGDQLKPNTRVAPKLPVKTFNQEAREPVKPLKPQAALPFEDFKRK